MATASAPISRTESHLGTCDVAFRKLLLAVDFSPQTKEATRTAISIAAAFQAEVVLMHAATPAMYGTGMEPVPIDSFEVNFDVAQANMQHLIDSEPAFRNIRHREVVQYATPNDLIRQITAEQHIDLLVAGSHGAGAVERLALGSTAEGMLRHIDCPSVIVGPRAKHQTHPFASILLATSLRPSDLRAAQYASSLARHFRTPLDIVHAVEPKQRNGTVHPEVLHSSIRRDMEELVPENFAASSRLATFVEDGRAADVILRVEKNLHPTLIVCGAGERSRLAEHTPWSTLAQVIRQANCPVLCVPHQFGGEND